MSNTWAAFIRKKTDNISDGETKLARVLNLVDLTALAVGSTLGLGVYVLAGSVAYSTAGPAVTISFFIAAVASAFAGICYAEFAARVPKAGSAYVYSYVTIGEFVAFTIGWNLILEYVIGTASVARGFSSYFDSLINHTMSETLTEKFPINVSFLSDYPDFLSFGIVLVLAALLAFGVKESSVMNNIFTGVNMITIFIVLVAGGLNASADNWSIPSTEVPAGFGSGGFMPYGIAGVLAGAARCFYGFIGFDCIATTGEEAINPKRDIPLAIVLALTIIFLSYFGISTVLTMMIPYFDQDPNAPFPIAFENIGWYAIKWIVTIGALFALSTSLLGAMFPMPRIIYAMGNDGLLFKRLSNVHSYTKTPILATIISGIFASIMTLIFNLDQLIDMMSIGTLLAYTIVSVCVLMLRYQDVVMTKEKTVSTFQILRQLYNGNSYCEPTELSSNITKVLVVNYAIICCLWCVLQKIYDISSTQGIICASVVGAILICIAIIIDRQPVSRTELSFKTPLVPYVPCLSIFVNLYLMFQLDVFTWIRFIVWIIIGYIVYFTYGIRHSTQIAKDNNQAQITTAAAVIAGADAGVGAGTAMNPRETHDNKGYKPEWRVENDHQIQSNNDNVVIIEKL